MRGAKQKEMFEISDLRRREILHLRSVCPCVTQRGEGGGGGTLIFSYIRRPGLFLGVKILNFNIFVFFSGKWIFLGYESPLGQKPTRTKAHWTISHWTKAHCLIWQGGQKPTSLIFFYKTVNPDQTASSGIIIHAVCFHWNCFSCMLWQTTLFGS